MADLSELSAQSLFNLKGWVTVVTGGGTGLGLITAKALAANGAKVYVTGRRAEKLKDAEMTDSASGGSIVGLQMDCTDKQSIQQGVRAISEKEKFVNLLVNNAGISSVNWGPNGMPKGDVKAVSEAMFNNQTYDDWLSVYKIDVASYYFTSVAFLPLLVAARDHGFPEAGSILNISSISGITKESQNGQYSYNAAKAACVSLTEQLAVDFKRPDLEVRVNQLAPGYFPSEMTPIEKDKGQQKEHFRTKWGVPFGRAGHSRDYAQAVLNFATNGYCTGSTLVIDGGWLLAHA
ncbi:related to 3-oxoacyl-[acyl-carrier- ] reductase 1 [Lecanosticta acicola]|uniref:Related to 3-oxoacyl-[acyl-carrier- ] reductase 1 n=1 Tax=Lecanosticta acicola TaxID=111012 RepID=A0AAI9EF10_9PEZI|nr:related to 3-oxoacyl-[acyl-carrier- ] reductase 1 [Lecanosticta acicola]